MTKDEIVKQEIVTTAQALFQQFGLKKTTMDDIAEACGKAKSTLYHYFKSKEEIFDEVLKIEINNLRRAVKEKVDRSTTLKDKVLNYLVTFHCEVVNKLNLFRFIKLSIEGQPSYVAQSKQKIDRREIVKNFIVFENDYLTQIFLEAYDSGEYKQIDRDDIPVFAETLVVSILGVIGYTIETNGKIDNEKLNRIATILVNQIFS